MYWDKYTKISEKKEREEAECISKKERDTSDNLPNLCSYNLEEIC